MSENSSEKSPERKGASIAEEVRQRLGVVRDKIAQIRQEQAATRQALAKEIVDMAEGNKRLAASGQRHKESSQAYREVERKKWQERSDFGAEVQRGKDELIMLSQEMERLQAEVQRDPSLKIELPSQEDLQELREAIAQGDKSLEALQREYDTLTQRHLAFQHEQEEFARNPLKSASDTVFWAHEQLTGKNVTQEERKAISEEVKIETQRRADEEKRLFDEGQKRQQMERNKEYLASLREIVDKVKSKFEALRESLNERLNGLNEELGDELFLKTIQRNWLTIEKDRALLESKVKRFFKFTRERNVQEGLQTHLDDLSGRFGERFAKAENINNEIGNFEYNRKQYTSGKGIHWVNEQARSHIITGNKEIDLPFKEIAKSSAELMNDVSQFKGIINQKVADYYKELNRVFNKKRIEDLQRSSRRYY